MSITFMRNASRPLPADRGSRAAPITSQFRQICANGDGRVIYDRLAGFVGERNLRLFHCFMGDPRRVPDDATLYAQIRGLMRDNAGGSESRAQAMGAAAATLIRDVVQPGRILDIGSGPLMRSTIVCARELGLDPAAAAYGVDVLPPVDDSVNYWQYDGAQLPSDIRIEGGFDAVILEQTMHHVADVAAIVREIDHVLVPGGIVFLKEHHVMSATDGMMVDIEHILHDMQSGQYFPVRRYYSCQAWDRVFAAYERTAADWFYAAPRMRTSATRTYYRIYRKPTTAPDTESAMRWPTFSLADTQLPADVAVAQLDEARARFDTMMKK